VLDEVDFSFDKSRGFAESETQPEFSQPLGRDLTVMLECERWDM
jgi:hypothetical protein